MSHGNSAKVRPPKRPTHATPRRPGWFGATLFHESMPLARVTDPETKLSRVMTARQADPAFRGSTYNVGRNVEKAADRRGDVVRRVEARRSRP